MLCRVIELYQKSLQDNGLFILDYDTLAAERHAMERARLTKIGKTPTFADGQIAAIAYANGLKLVTRNIADFETFEELKIENWFDQ